MRHATALLLMLAAPLAACDVDGLSVTQYHDDRYGTDWLEHCGEEYACVEVWYPDGDELVPVEICKRVPPCPVVDLMADDAPPELVTEGDEGWPAPFISEVGPVHWGSGDIGGATATFTGTGGAMCAIVDPQTVWRDDWAVTHEGTVTDMAMADFIYDDGDLDMLVGMSADYTGTPGQTMGSFKRTFTDPLGVQREADFNLCLMFDRYGIAGAAAGRATPEWCTIQTVQGVEYTVALLTFSVPLDDDALRFALQLREGECPAEVNECTLRGDADPKEFPEEIAIEVGNFTYEYEDLEQKYCEPAHL